VTVAPRVIYTDLRRQIRKQQMHGKEKPIRPPAHQSVTLSGGAKLLIDISSAFRPDATVFLDALDDYRAIASR
jgi:hypothetical protein